jgi:NAD(P)-dependent dehydrogenase (short-subunit alcohol dehydrogenase family)
VLSPGGTVTDLAKAALGEEGTKFFASLTPLKRMADPAEIGAAAAFLASSDSSFMTASEVSGTRIQSNFSCSIGYGNPASVFPRNPRLSFEEAGRWA